MPEDEDEDDDDLEEGSFALVLLMVSLIPSDPGFTMYSPGFLPGSPGLPVLLALFISVPLVGVGMRSRLPLPALLIVSQLTNPAELALLILVLIPPLVTVTAISSHVVCCDFDVWSLSTIAEREFFLFRIWGKADDVDCLQSCDDDGEVDGPLIAWGGGGGIGVTVVSLPIEKSGCFLILDDFNFGL